MVETKVDLIYSSPLMSFPKPMEEETFWPLLLDFSFITSSSLDTSPGELIFFFFLFLWRGGSFLGKANMGKMTRSMAKAHKRKPIHLRGRNRNNRWVVKGNSEQTDHHTGNTRDLQAVLQMYMHIYQLPTKRGSLWSMLTTVLGST